MRACCTVVLSTALTASPAVALDPETVPEGLDVDLILGKSCSGHPSAKDRAARLPRAVNETVVMWPRAGKRTIDGVCQSVTRFTLVNHTGQVITMSFVLTKEGTPTPPDGWELVENEGPRRARFRASQDNLGAPGDPPGVSWFLESESAPTASQETLESILGFFDPPAIVRTIVTGEDPPDSEPHP